MSYYSQNHAYSSPFGGYNSRTPYSPYGNYGQINQRNSISGVKSSLQTTTSNTTKTVTNNNGMGGNINRRSEGNYSHLRFADSNAFSNSRVKMAQGLTGGNNGVGVRAGNNVNVQRSGLNRNFKKTDVANIVNSGNIKRNNITGGVGVIKPKIQKNQNLVKKTEIKEKPQIPTKIENPKNQQKQKKSKILNIQVLGNPIPAIRKKSFTEKDFGLESLDDLNEDGLPCLVLKKTISRETYINLDDDVALDLWTPDTDLTRVSMVGSKNIGNSCYMYVYSFLFLIDFFNSPFF